MNEQVKAIRNEIKRRMEKHWDLLPDADSPEDDWTHNELCELGAYKELEHLETFLDSLPESNCPKLSDNLEDAAGVKETPINLDDEIVEYWEVMEWSKSIPLSKFKVIARYFYGLGLAARLKITMAEDKEVKSAAVTTADRLLANPKDYALSAKADYWNGAYEGFVAGAQWQKDTVNIDISKQIAAAFQLGGKDKEEQMMKDAVAVEVVGEKRDLRLIDSTQRCLFNAERGDWLRVIIVKEDKK